MSNSFSFQQERCQSLLGYSESLLSEIFSVSGTDVEILEGFHATDLHCESSLFESCKAHCETLSSSVALIVPKRGQLKWL
jgi:Uri superfamily endonuclease